MALKVVMTRGEFVVESFSLAGGWDYILLYVRIVLD